jgi:hypothetical protein
VGIVKQYYEHNKSFYPDSVQILEMFPPQKSSTHAFGEAYHRPCWQIHVVISARFANTGEYAPYLEGPVCIYNGEVIYACWNAYLE